MQGPLWRPLLVCAVAGLAQAASIAWPAGGQPVGWLQVLSLSVQVAVVWGQPSWRRAAAAGWAFAIAWLAMTWWWLFISMHVYGGLPAPLAMLAVLALAAALGLYYGVAAGMAWRLSRPVAVPGVLASLVFAAAWLLAELARGRWFTGFPWGAGGYAHVDGWLAVLAPWAGVYGIGAVAAFAAACLAAARRAVSARWALAAVGLVAAVMAWVPAGPIEPHGSPMAVSLLQGNIPQDEKFRPGSGIPQALSWYARELRDAADGLVVAPETAIPLLPRHLPPGYLDEIAAPFIGARDQGRGQSKDRAALIGLPLGDAKSGYTNSVIGLRPGAGDIYRFDKYHLVPFGEFVPPLFRWFTDLMEIPLGDFARGGLGQASFEWQGQRLAPNVCYEDLFGEELGARFAHEPQAPTVFVNVSNIAWFGDTVAIDQHLGISRMRALEFRRPVIRATNTGATAIIDGQGRVTAQLPPHTRGVLRGQVQGQSGLTPYARWVSAWQLAPLWAASIAILLIAAILLKRRPSD